MRRGSTPDYMLTVAGYDLTSCTTYLTIEQYANQLNLTGDRLTITYDGSASTIVFSLTQEETLAFNSGGADVQVRFIDSQGKAYVTDIQTMNIRPVLFEEVIEYVGE